MILPVVGLLLLLGLFWYWASTLIGDDGNSPGATSTSAVAIVITPENPTATATTEANVPVQTAQTGAGEQTTAEATNPPANATNPPATESTTAGGKFAPDDHVVTNDSVNMRSDPTTSGSLILTLPAGTDLTILDGPETADGYTWWHVTDQATGDEGWVIEDAIDLSN